MANPKFDVTKSIETFAPIKAHYKAGQFPGNMGSLEDWERNHLIKIRDINNVFKSTLGDIAKHGAKILNYPAEHLMSKGFGDLARWGEDMKFWKIAWDDPATREFFYHNAPIANDAVARLYANIKTYKEVFERPISAVVELGVNLTEQFVSGKKFKDFTFSERAKFWKNQGPSDNSYIRNYKEGQKWAEENPESVDSLLQAGFDPLWVLGPVRTAALSEFAKADIKMMTGIVKQVRKSGSIREQFKSLENVYGNPRLGHLFNVTKSVQDPHQAAEILHNLGYRAAFDPRIAKWRSSPMVPRFFRRPSKFGSDDIADITEEGQTYQRLIREQYSHALQKIRREIPGGLSKGEWDDVNWLMNNIHPGHDVKSMENMMEITAHNWQLAGKLPRNMTPDSIRAAAMARPIVEMGRSKLTPFRGPYGQNLRKIVTEEFEKVKKVAKADSPLKAAWRKPRQMLPGQTVQDVPAAQSHKEFTKWLAGIRSRDFRVDKLNEFISGPVRSKRKFLERAAKESTTPAGRQRFNEGIRDLDQFIAGIKDWESSALGKEAIKRGVSPLLKPWDAMLSAVKQGQLVYNPAWYMQNFFDTTIIKNTLIAGRPLLDDLDQMGRFPPIAKRATGKSMDFGATLTSDIIGFDIPQGLLKVGNDIEQFGRMKAGSYVYWKKYRELVGQGVPLTVADTQSFDLAQKVVKDFHFNYDDYSMFESVARRVFPFFTFNTRNNLLYMKLALKHPMETQALLATRRFQQEHLSVDRRGEIRIPGTNVSVDPIQNLSFNRSMDLIADPNRSLGLEDSRQNSMVRLAQLIGGPTALPLDVLLKDRNIPGIGSFPNASWKSPVPIERVIDSVGRALGEKDGFSPVDRVLSAVGWDGIEKKAEFRDRFARSFMWSAENEGKQLTATQAEDSVNRFQAMQNVLGFFTGIYVRPSTPGWNRLKLLQEVHGDILDTGDQEAADIFRQEYNLEPVTPRTRSKEAQSLDAIEKMDEEKLMRKAAETPKGAKLQELKKFVSGHPLYALAVKLFNPGEAGAVEIKPPSKETQELFDKHGVKKVGDRLIPDFKNEKKRDLFENAFKKKAFHLELKQRFLKYEEAESASDLELNLKKNRIDMEILTHKDFAGKGHFKLAETARHLKREGDLRSLPEFSLPTTAKDILDANRLAYRNYLGGAPSSSIETERRYDVLDLKQLEKGMAPFMNNRKFILTPELLKIFQLQTHIPSRRGAAIRSAKLGEESTDALPVDPAEIARRELRYAHRALLPSVAADIQEQIQNDDIPADFWQTLSDQYPNIHRRLYFGAQQQTAVDMRNSVGAIGSRSGRYIVDDNSVRGLFESNENAMPYLAAIEKGLISTGDFASDKQIAASVRKIEAFPQFTAGQLDEFFKQQDDAKRGISTKREVRAQAQFFTGATDDQFKERLTALDDLASAPPPEFKDSKTSKIKFEGNFRTIGEYISFVSNETGRRVTDWRDRRAAAPDKDVFDIANPAPNAFEVAGDHVGQLPPDRIVAGTLRTLQLAETVGAIDIGGSQDFSRAVSGLGTGLSAQAFAQSVLKGGSILAYAAARSTATTISGIAIGQLGGTMAGFANFLSVAAGPVGIAVGIGLGVAQAFGAFDRKPKEDPAREARRAEAQRQSDARQAERARRTSVAQTIQASRALTSIFTDTARRSRVRSATRAQQLSFRRRPTFASRLGLAESVARQLSSTLRPRL